MKPALRTITTLAFLTMTGLFAQKSTSIGPSAPDVMASPINKTLLAPEPQASAAPARLALSAVSAPEKLAEIRARQAELALKLDALKAAYDAAVAERNLLQKLERALEGQPVGAEPSTSSQKPSSPSGGSNPTRPSAGH